MKGLYRVGPVELITPLQSDDPFPQALLFLLGLGQQFRKLCFPLWKKKKIKSKISVSRHEDNAKFNGLSSV